MLGDLDRLQRDFLQIFSNYGSGFRAAVCKIQALGFDGSYGLLRFL